MSNKLELRISVADEYDVEESRNTRKFNEVEKSLHLIPLPQVGSIIDFNDFDFEQSVYLEIGFYDDEDESHFQTSHRIYKLTFNNINDKKNDDETVNVIEILDYISSKIGLEHLPNYSLTEQEGVLDKIEKKIEDYLNIHNITMFEILKSEFVGDTSPKNNLEISVTSPITRSNIAYIEIQKNGFSGIIRLFNKETTNKLQLSFKENVHRGLLYYNFGNYINAIFNYSKNDTEKIFNQEIFK